MLDPLAVAVAVAPGSRPRWSLEVPSDLRAHQAPAGRHGPAVLHGVDPDRNAGLGCPAHRGCPVSALMSSVPLISAAELCQLQNDGWGNGSPDGRGLHVRDGWMVVLLRGDEKRIVIVQDDDDEAPAPTSPLSGSAADCAPSGNNSSALNSSDTPQRNAGVAEPDAPLPVTVDDSERTADCLPRDGFGRSPAIPLSTP